MALSSTPRQRASWARSSIAELDEKSNSTLGRPDVNTRLEKQVSKASIGLGMGSRKASLYLSRATTLVQIPLEKGGTTDSGELTTRSEGALSVTPRDGAGVLLNSQDREVTISTIEQQRNADTNADTKKGGKKSTNNVLAPRPLSQKEFTFTGYDIMEDTGVPPRKAETPREQREREHMETYHSACRLAGTAPVNYISRHINDEELVMKSHPLGSQGARAVCIALVSNRTVQKLDLEDNDIGPEGAIYIADMLKENETITDVRLAENSIRSRGVCAFADLLKDGKMLFALDVSGGGLEDADSRFIADMIEFNAHLRILNVSHNRLSDNGAFAIGRAIAINDTLQELDLGWNHIRGKGTLAIALGVQKNVALKYLNISWNGFALEGAKGLGRAMEENRTLRELDVAHNRLDTKGVGELLKGLQVNDGLETLRIGNNPYPPETALIILKTIGESDKSVVTKLDMSDIVVRNDFLKTWDEIKTKRPIPLRVTFGSVVKSMLMPGKDPNALDWRDPVVRLFKFMHDQGYRVIDMLKSLDKDGSLSVDREEFKKGFLTKNSPLSEDQLDEVMTRLDTDGDGEVDLGELLKGEKEFRRKMMLRTRRLMNQGKQDMGSVVKKLMEIEIL